VIGFGGGGAILKTILWDRARGEDRGTTRCARMACGGHDKSSLLIQNVLCIRRALTIGRDGASCELLNMGIDLAQIASKDG